MPLAACVGSAVDSFPYGERHARRKQGSNYLETVCPQPPDSPGKPRTPRPQTGALSTRPEAEPHSRLTGDADGSLRGWAASACADFTVIL